MPVARLYRRGNPPVPRTWTALRAFNSGVVFRELLEEVNSIRSFCDLSAFDWEAVVAPPDDSPLFTDAPDVVDGWPTAHYFGWGIHQIATALQESFDAMKGAGYVWESPATWTESDDADRWAAPDAFLSLFDDGLPDGFGANFKLMEKWKCTVEALRDTCDSLLVMFLSIASVAQIDSTGGVTVKQAPQISTETVRFVRYVPLARRMCVYGGTQYWRSITPTIYDNSPTAQLFCVDGPLAPNPGWLPSETTTVQTDRGLHTTCNVRVGSIGSTVNAQFFTLEYDGGVVAASSNEQGLFSISNDTARGIVAYPKTGKRMVGLNVIGPGYESGQAAPYNTIAGLPDVGNLRHYFDTFNVITSEQVAAYLNAAQPSCTRRVGGYSTNRYLLEYVYEPDEDRDFVVVVEYPCVFTRDWTGAELAALTASVTVTIHGEPFIVSVAPNGSATISETVHIDSQEVYITASVTNAEGILTAAADMWKRRMSDYEYTQETRWYTDTGEVVSVGGEAASVVDWTATTSGLMRNAYVPDEPLVSGFVRIRIERT